MKPHISSPAEQALAGFRSELTKFGEEVLTGFKSSQKMPIKDRVELLEHQMMQMRVLMNRMLLVPVSPDDGDSAE